MLTDDYYELTPVEIFAHKLEKDQIEGPIHLQYVFQALPASASTDSSHPKYPSPSFWSQWHMATPTSNLRPLKKAQCDASHYCRSSTTSDSKAPLALLTLRPHFQLPLHRSNPLHPPPLLTIPSSRHGSSSVSLFPKSLPLLPTIPRSKSQAQSSPFSQLSFSW